MTQKAYDFTLKELLILILRKSGIIFLCALIVSLITFGGTYLSYQLNKDAVKLNYQLQMEKYTLAEREKKEVIEKYNDQLESMNDYYSKSILMQVDPQNVRTAYFDFFIKETIPSSSIENQNSLISALYGAYISALAQVPFETLLGDLFPTGYEDGYIRETIKLTNLFDPPPVSLENPVLRIVAIGDYQIDPIVVVERVFDYFSSKQDEISVLIRSHQLFPLGKIEIFTQDISLAEQQKLKLNEINTTFSNLKSQEEDYKKIQSNRPTIANGMKNVIKNSGLAFAAGMAAAIAFIITAYLANNRIQTAYQIQEQLGIRYLGGGLHKKGKLFARLADCLCGTTGLATDPDVRSLVFSNVLESLHGEEKSILLTGTLNQSDIQSLSNSLIFDDPIKVYVAVDLPNNPSAIELLDQIQSVIIVERIGVSKLSAIYRIVERARQSDKEIIGYTLI